MSDLRVPAQCWQRATPDLIAAAVAQAPEIGDE